jgi:hypothetical protein
MATTQGSVTNYDRRIQGREKMTMTPSGTAPRTGNASLATRCRLCYIAREGMRRSNSASRRACQGSKGLAPLPLLLATHNNTQYMQLTTPSGLT